jgi:hypothetical protein
MAATQNKKLAKAKKKVKKRTKAKTTRTVPLGDPNLVQLHLEVDKKTSEVVNMGKVVDQVDGSTVKELQELHHSLFSKKTRMRNKPKLQEKILGFLADVQEGFEGKAAEKSKATPKKAKKPSTKPKAVKEKKTKAEPVPPPDPIPDKVGSSWPKTYRGAHFELYAVDGGYRLEGPSGHQAVGKVYSSPTAAGKALTGYRSMNGRKFFSMDPGERDGIGRRSPVAKHLKPRDPRLPMPGERIFKHYNDKRYSITVLDDGQFEVCLDGDEGMEKPIGTYDSVSAAASAISDCQENGYRFFNLDFKVDTLDPWKALVGVLSKVVDNFETADETIEFIEAAVQDAEDLDFQGSADVLARHFYKGKALAKIKATTPEL